MFGRAFRPRRIRRQPGLRSADQPHRHDQLPRGCTPPPRRRDFPLDAAACIRSPGCAGFRSSVSAPGWTSPPTPRDPGWSSRGHHLRVPVCPGSRSMYGATKLASELLVEEYRAMYGLRTIVNRCGVHLGALADGKSGSGVPGAVGGAAPLRRQPVLHRLRRRRAAGPRRAARRRPLRPDAAADHRPRPPLRRRATTSAAGARTACRSPS